MQGEVKLVRKVSVLLVIFAFTLIACESHQLQEEKNDRHQEEQVKREIQTAEVEANFFQQVVSWFEDDSILYINNTSDGAELVQFNLYDGTSTIFFQTNYPIVQVIPNQNFELFYIQTSPSSYEATMYIVDKEGETLFEKSFSSYDVFLRWSPYSESQFILTKFYEDWTFDTVLFDIVKGMEIENVVNVPFMEWAALHKVSYIDWNSDEPELSAPLYVKDIQTKETKKIADDVIGHAYTPNHFVLLQEYQDKSASGRLSIWDITAEKVVREFEVPLIAQYSQWLFPYYEISSESEEFYTFVPADIMNENPSFHLKRYDLNTGEETTILTNVLNEPILLSPNGEYILYGYRFEKVVDLNEKSVIPIIEER